MTDTSKLQIQTATLKAVQKITKASFDESLGDYSITFNCMNKALSIDLWLGGEIQDVCAIGSRVLGGFCFALPKSVKDIYVFEVNVCNALTVIFDYVNDEVAA